ncbi:MAG: hypothetical protein DRQ55_04715 [Planctomycetota bacterium]|nr:MAG: hypothetical protein DRQ55_04715 [Planctomycetota bacterium]
MDAAGRLLPFDRGRLTASLRRALLGDSELAQDLSAVSAAWLSRPEQGPVVGLSELSSLAARVLDGAGACWAATRFRQRDSGLDRRAADGLRPAPWSGDDAGVDRGRALGPIAAAPADALAALGPDAGPGAEGRLVRRMLASQVRGSMLGDAVRVAESAGLLDVSGHVGGARVPAATLSMTWLERHRGPELGAELRCLARLVTDELCVPWPGRPPTCAELRSLARHLKPASPEAPNGAVVLALPAQQAPLIPGLLAALEKHSAPRLRLVGELSAHSAGQVGLTALDAAGVEQVSAWPAAGVDVGAATLDLPLVAAATGQRAGDFLALTEELADEALGALASLEAAGLGATARHELQPHAGDARRLRLVLRGAPRLPRLLLSWRVDELTSDLLSALGERLARSLQRSRLPAALDLSPGEGFSGPDAGAHARRLGLCDRSARFVSRVVPCSGDVAAASSSSLHGSRPCA